MENGKCTAFASGWERELLLSNLPLEEDGYFGYALVTYFEEAEAEARALMAALSARGIAYRDNCLSEKRFSERPYAETLALLDSCRRYILVLSDTLEISPTMPRTGLSPEDAWAGRRVLLNRLWYEIGYISSRNTERILDADKRERFFCAVAFRRGSFAIEKTPGLGTHIDYLLMPGASECPNFDTLSAFADKLARATPILVRDSFAERVSEREETELTLSPREGISRRIGYRRLRLCLPISKPVFEEMAEAIGDTKEALDERLDELVCGVRVFRFSKLDHEIDLPSRPYRLEADVWEGEYPRIPSEEGLAPRFAHTVRYVRYGEEKCEAYREYYLDVTLPIHRIFGVCFKLYLSAPSLKAQVLSGLLFPEWREKETDLVTVDPDKNRVWFSLGFEPNATAVQKRLPACGARADVIYPS